MVKTDDEFITQAQLARQLSCSLMTLWRWRHDPNSKFPNPIKIGRRWLYSRGDVNLFLDVQKRQSGTQAKAS